MTALAVDDEVRTAIWDRFIRGEEIPLSVSEFFDLLRPAWMRSALCARRGQALFFVGRGGSTRPAMTLCAACVVREQCLEYALDNPELQGVWGGTSEQERRALRVSGR